MQFSPSTNGFYDPLIHGDTVPDDAVDITTEDYIELLAAQAQGATLQSDETGMPVAVFPAAPTTAQLKATQLASINADCESAIATITTSYPSSEVLSWPKQEAEARTYIADNAAATPLLDALAQARGVAKADLAGRVIAKADAFSAMSGSLIGKRQALEDALMALPADATSEQIAAIVWTA